MDFMAVLYNIRGTVECTPGEVRTVEECKGWAENKYTAYLRDLEAEFECGPLHGDLFGAKASTVSSALLQAAHAEGGRWPRGGWALQPQPHRAALLEASAAPVPGRNFTVVGGTVVSDEEEPKGD